MIKKTIGVVAFLITLFLLLGCSETAINVGGKEYKCEGKDNQNCISLSSTMKTCYTLPDRKGGKRCLDFPYWEKSVEVQNTDCSECPIKVIGYVNDCETGKRDKYFCDDIGQHANCDKADNIFMPFGG